MRRTLVFAVLAAAAVAAAEYEVSLVRGDLAAPTGIAVSGGGRGATIYFTQRPTPGVPGTMGGMNSVDVLLPNGQIRNLHRGEPDPVNLALGSNTVYWTCRTAGVINYAVANQFQGQILTGLDHPVGIDVDRHGNLYFTEVPTPAIPGSLGGMNTVNVFNGQSILELSMGEPEPVDIAIDDRTGTAYWTCKSAGVILQKPRGGMVSLFLGGLNKPVGIDVKGGHLYFTEVPTPGVPGNLGGMNAVWKVNIATGARTLVAGGDPEPTDVSVSNSGTVYWTCTVAGVIVKAEPVR